VTHELKSPLASIVFAIGALRDRILGPVNDAQEQILKAASNSADYLRDTIANYLNLSRIEEGELRLRWSVVAVRADILAPVLDRVSELAAERRMRIECEVPPDVAGACDPSLITSVFQNLLSNAVKYGREGGRIRVTAGSDETPGFLRFHVWNEGEGFPSGEGEKLFRKFSRLTHGGDDTKSGTGLGLFVSRVIVEKHGGRIEAESAPGQWADFSFTLPTTVPRPETPVPSE
jgi:signal transduction histidine kinase